MDTERPIEQRLRAYGKSRRACAGDVSLHPATRRLLQGEVARTFRRDGKAARETSPSSRIWMRIAWSGAVLGTLIVLLLTVTPEKQAPSEIALLKTEMSVERIGENLPPAIHPGPTAESDKNRAFPLAKLADALTAPAPASAPIPPASAIAAPAAKEQPLNSLFATVPAAGGIKPAATSEAPAPLKGVPQVVANSLETDRVAAGMSGMAAGRPADSSALGDTLSLNQNAADKSKQLASAWDEHAPSAVYYSRTDSNGGPSLELPGTSAGAWSMARRQVSEDRRLESPRDTFMANQSYVRRASPVESERVSPGERAQLLSNFRVQNTSAGFEVIDADGSVYKGHLEAAQEAKKAFGKAEETAKLGAFSMTPVKGEQTLLFRVAGTNQSLRKHVFITGQLVPQVPVTSQPAQSSLDFSNEQVQVGLRYQNNFSNQAGLILSNQLQLAPVLQNSFIEGKMRVGQEPEIEIRAVPQNFSPQNK